MELKAEKENIGLATGDSVVLSGEFEDIGALEVLKISGSEADVTTKDGRELRFNISDLIKCN